ncbi:hypothetical protein DW659_04520 [Lachnospiraceae bacterium AM23-7LB]|jgi:wobble nucleotide-excising tRNase|nr:hypothetical protein DW659_04520 [Lachnospiraceae bacterium AM23-7LB]RHV60175.1 hypothetical protein DXB19_05895 [Lachnospiraceae bacterium OM02-26]
MIKKIISINNYNKFILFNHSQTNWDCSLKKATVIYAPNGSGKTSLSLMFKSLCDNSSLHAKASFQASAPTEIRLLGDDNKQFIYMNNKWNRNHSCIEIFNSFYLEDNIYSISIHDNLNELNIFELICADEALQLKSQMCQIKRELSLLKPKIRNRKMKLRQNKMEIKNDKTLKKLLLQREQLNGHFKQLGETRISLINSRIDSYIQNINRYLATLSDDLKIIDQKIVYISQSNELRFIYGLKINNHEIHFSDRQAEAPSLKYYLSEGDKNALALSFFLAKIDIVPNPKDYIVVVDDPFTSFDTHRKQTTITQLTRIANKVGQIIILTHDLHFANDFCNAYNGECLTLQIQRRNASNTLVIQDIKNDLLTGLSKDINTLHQYIYSGEQDTLYLREVVRCIRPCIEGIFRLKYFNLVKDNQWLGDFISMIRDSDISSPLYRLKDYLPEIEELNEYSKIYHHSNPNYLDVLINPTELSIHVRSTINLLYVL